VFVYQVGEVVNTLCGYKTLNKQVSGALGAVILSPHSCNGLQPPILNDVVILRNTHSDAFGENHLLDLDTWNDL